MRVNDISSTGDLLKVSILNGKFDTARESIIALLELGVSKQGLTALINKTVESYNNNELIVTDTMFDRVAA